MHLRIKEVLNDVFRFWSLRARNLRDRRDAFGMRRIRVTDRGA